MKIKLVQGKKYRHKIYGPCKFISVDPEDGAWLIMEEVDREDGDICKYFGCEEDELEELE